MSQATNLKSGSFTATGDAAAGEIFTPRIGNFNIAVWGTFVGELTLKRSLDGTIWLPVGTYSALEGDSEFEAEPGVQYRFTCSAFTSGTINWRLSQ